MSARCIAPISDDGEQLCGAPATEERRVEGLVCPLCEEHARELDEESASPVGPCFGDEELFEEQFRFGPRGETLGAYQAAEKARRC